MADELKPCPFCGGEAFHLMETSGWIACKDCGAESRILPTREDAEAVWNRRIECDRLARLEAALEEIAEYDTGATAGVAYTAKIALGRATP